MRGSMKIDLVLCFAWVTLFLPRQIFSKPFQIDSWSKVINATAFQASLHIWFILMLVHYVFIFRHCPALFALFWISISDLQLSWNLYDVRVVLAFNYWNSLLQKRILGSEIIKIYRIGSVEKIQFILGFALLLTVRARIFYPFLEIILSRFPWI